MFTYYFFHPLTGLPLCLDTEDTTPNPTDVISVDPDETVPGNPSSKATRIQISDVFAVALLTMFFQHFSSLRLSFVYFFYFFKLFF